MRVFRGVWPALVTPSTDDFGVNVPVLRALTEHLIAKGVDGFYIGGTTGEGIFMPVTNRKTIAENVLEQVNGRIPVIVHVGCIALPDAIDLAHHAQEHGAVGISSIMPPLYDTLDSISRYFRSVAGSVPELPFLAYLLNPNIDTVALLQQLMDIPNLAGTKYTGPNMYEFRQILELGAGRWTMFSGMDEQCLYAAMMGSTGNVGSTLNIMPGAYQKMRALVETGEFTAAQELQERVNTIINVMISVGFQGALKAALGLLGFDCGLPRLPRLPLTAEQHDTLRHGLDETDFAVLAAL